jgi:hypothetical protein
LGDKIVNSCVFGNLRELRAVAKSVWQEEYLGLDIKFIPEEVLAV